MKTTKEIWFPAKKYGYGWGPPVRWQGWAVIAFYIVAVVGGLAVFPTKERPWYFLAYILVVTAALVAVCAWKGEPPRWRWGDKERIDS
jgi:hypothetical protein